MKDLAEDARAAVADEEVISIDRVEAVTILKAFFAVQDSFECEFDVLRVMWVLH